MTLVENFNQNRLTKTRMITKQICKGEAPAKTRALMIVMWNLLTSTSSCRVTALKPLVSSLSEHVHPRSCFRELWDFIFLSKPSLMFYI